MSIEKVDGKKLFINCDNLLFLRSNNVMYGNVMDFLVHSSSFHYSANSLLIIIFIVSTSQKGQKGDTFTCINMLV